MSDASLIVARLRAFQGSHRFYGNGGTKFSKKSWNVTDPPIITVVRKASFDVVHSLKDQTGEATFEATLRGKFIR